MGINCCKEDGLDEVTHCGLNNDVVVVTIADELEHAEATKV